MCECSAGGADKITYGNCCKQSTLICCKLLVSFLVFPPHPPQNHWPEHRPASSQHWSLGIIRLNFKAVWLCFCQSCTADPNQKSSAMMLAVFWKKNIIWTHQQDIKNLIFIRGRQQNYNWTAHKLERNNRLVFESGDFVLHSASRVVEMLFLPLRPSLLSFPSWWLLILCDIASGVMRLIAWFVDPHTLFTQLRDIPPVVLAQTRYELLFIRLWITQYVDLCQGFSTFFPSENMWHQSFLWPDSPTLILPVSAEKEKKKDGSVSKEAHSSWEPLITVMTGRETQDERQERWSAADMAGISRQRWDESTYSAAMPCCWYMAVTSHPARHQHALRRRSRTVS